MFDKVKRAGLQPYLVAAVLSSGLGVFACALLSGCGEKAESVSAQTAPQQVQTLLSKAESAPTAAEPTPGDSASTLPVYALKIDPSHLQVIEMNPYANMAFPATFSAGGKRYDGVKVRARGSWSRSWPKKSLKILFDHTNAFDGQTSLNLNSGWRDPAFVREVVAYKVYAACGVPSPKARMVRLDVNGRFGGLYVEVEQPGKQFLSRCKLKGASVYKAASQSRDADERDLGDDQAYKGVYKKQTKKSEGYTDLEEFCSQLAHTPNTLEFFNQRVDVDEYINFLAATVLVQNWDTYNKNHYLVHDVGGSGKWYVVPWDLDRTLGDHWNRTFGEARFAVLQGTRSSPGVTGWNRLEDRFFSEPSLRLRFLDRLATLIETEFTAAKLFPLVDQLEKEIGREANLDRAMWPGQVSDVHSGISGVKRYIEQRREFLKREIPRLRSEWSGN